MDSLADSDSSKADKAALGKTSTSMSSNQSVRSQTVSSLIDATVMARTLTTAGLDDYCFSFILSDGAVLDLASLGTGEVVVTGPRDYQQSASFVGIDKGAICYRVTAPHGTWTQADKGVYQINVVVDKATSPILVRVFQVDIVNDLGRCLLQNSDFEAGLTYWITFSGAERVIQTGTYTGKSALLLSSAESGTQQNVRVTPGRMYQLTGYGRSTSLGYSSFGMTFFDEQGSLLARSDVGTISSSQWQDYFVIALAPTRAAYVQVWTYQDFDRGLTQIDGLSLRQINPDDMPPPQVSQFVLINGPLSLTDRTFSCER